MLSPPPPTPVPPGGVLLPVPGRPWVRGSHNSGATCFFWEILQIIYYRINLRKVRIFLQKIYRNFADLFQQTCLFLMCQLFVPLRSLSGDVWGEGGLRLSFTIYSYVQRIDSPNLSTTWARDSLQAFWTNIYISLINKIFDMNYILVCRPLLKFVFSCFIRKT